MDLSGMVICTMTNIKGNIITPMRTDNNIKSDRLNVEVSSYCQGYFGKMLCWLTKKKVRPFFKYFSQDITI